VQVQCGGCGQVVAGRPSADARAPLRHGWSTGTARRGGRGRGTEAVTARRRDGNGVYTVHAADAAVVVSAVAGTHGDQKHWSSGSGIMNTETAKSSRVPGLHVPWRSRPPAAQPVTSKKKKTVCLESSQDPSNDFAQQAHYASPNGTGDYYTIRRRMCYRVQNALR